MNKYHVLHTAHIIT